MNRTIRYIRDAFSKPDEEIGGLTDDFDRGSGIDSWDPVTGVDASPEHLSALRWYALAIVALGLLFALIRGMAT